MLMCASPNPDLQVDQTIRVGGWVKTGREAGAGAFAFVQLNDGTSFESLQVRFRFLVDVPALVEWHCP